jgi:hypothetical protein
MKRVAQDDSETSEKDDFHTDGVHVESETAGRNTEFRKAKTRKRQPDSVFKDSCRAPSGESVEKKLDKPRRATRKGWKRHPWYLDSTFKNLAKASLHGAAGREFSPFAKKLFPNTNDFDPAVFASVLIHCDANKNGMFVNGPLSDLESYKELRVIKQSLTMMGITSARGNVPSDGMLFRVIEYVDGIDGELLASNGLGRLVGEIISLTYDDRKRLRLDNLKAAGMTDKAHEAKRAEEAVERARKYRRGKGRPSKNDVVIANIAKADALHAVWNPDGDPINDDSARKRRRDGEKVGCKNWREYQSYLKKEAEKAKRAKVKEADKRAERAPLPRSDGTKVELAWWFISELLAYGWVEQNIIKAEMGEAGHKWASVRRAALMGSVASIKIRETGKFARWYWSLPEHAKMDPRQMLKCDVEPDAHLPDAQVASRAPRTQHLTESCTKVKKDRWNIPQNPGIAQVREEDEFTTAHHQPISAAVGGHGMVEHSSSRTTVDQTGEPDIEVQRECAREGWRVQAREVHANGNSGWPSDTAKRYQVTEKVGENSDVMSEKSADVVKFPGFDASSEKWNAWLAWLASRRA